MILDSLKEGFDYDVWANRAWLAWAETSALREDAPAILEHHVRCYSHWIETCFSEEEIPGREPTLMATLEKMAEAWKDLLSRCDIEAFASVEREGKVYYIAICDIARHVINHGTYHRGELRGLCRAKGIEGFPETDFVRWIRERE